MESYNLLLKRYNALLKHFKVCHCKCKLNSECLLVYDCLKALFAQIKSEPDFFGKEEVDSLVEPEEPKVVDSGHCSKKNPLQEVRS
jgi:hypothetical protein